MKFGVPKIIIILSKFSVLYSFFYLIEFYDHDRFFFGPIFVLTKPTAMYAYKIFLWNETRMPSALTHYKIEKQSQKKRKNNSKPHTINLCRAFMYVCVCVRWIVYCAFCVYDRTSSIFSIFCVCNSIRYKNQLPPKCSNF